jgi:phage baseplate assembly protein W
MTVFVGFNTINQFKKFTLTDFDLIKRDLLNAFNIRQGQLPGRPAYGSSIYDFLFEPQTQKTQQEVIQEIQRVAGGDPRIYVSDLQCYPQENGLLVELQIQVIPSKNAERLSIFFDQQQRNASYV